MSFALRYGDWTANGFAHWPSYFLASLIAIPVFARAGLYRAVIRYIGYHALWSIFRSVTIAVLGWALVTYLIDFEDRVPRSVILIYWFISLVLIGGIRVGLRWLLLKQCLPQVGSDDLTTERVIVYGAGAAGRQLATALSHSREFVTLAFVDDNQNLVGMEVEGVGVYSPSELSGLINRFDIDAVLLAIPSASKQRRQLLVDSLSDLPIRVMTLPGMADLAGGKVSINDVREVDIADLLGRDEVHPHEDLLSACISGQQVLVTGAGGSIGSELCRQILTQKPCLLVLFESSEYALYTVERELRELCAAAGTQLVAILGSVLDKAALEQLMLHYRIDTVYHAAAYKHVPLVEGNMIAGVRNNLLGTWYTAEAALTAGVNNFVLISTDKAVRPTNVMGASKRFAEMVLQALAQREGQASSTRFAMVRFGNVLGSSGSVIPLFKQQIEKGGPVTVTHPDITRYFMTIPEAATLVLQAGSMGCSGDVFVLDMGEPVKIKSLAKKMINLSGHSVAEGNNLLGDIEIVYTGLRDGEKLYEELLIGDSARPTEHPMIMRASEEMLPWQQLQPKLAEAEKAFAHFDVVALRKLLLEVVNGYSPQQEICDLQYLREAQQLQAEQRSA